MTRREFLYATSAGALAAQPRSSRQLAITMDDVAWRVIPEPFAKTANARLLSALAKSRVQAGLFVAGSNVDDDPGREVVRSWGAAGHLIGNHTYSHQPYSRESVTPEWFEDDVLRCEKIIQPMPGFRKFFRFPLLKEGATVGKRDAMRRWLAAHEYRNGYVTVDASDWYYDRRLRAKVQADPRFDVSRFRQPYLDHILDRMAHYDALAQRVSDTGVMHTLLIHYNLLNVLFLDDLLAKIQAAGWRLIGVSQAYTDPIGRSLPDVLPAGESLLWSFAKEKGITLPYPGEDESTEKPKLDRLGL